jgi:prepilin-type N-terminal cleavage/methylation domain-containing protein/prepilin-type processing-associated H-X9-DG protein
MYPVRFRRAGFTLIELLVVIAIIAILAAILFPVFAQAREKARAASCLSNTKQISLAFSMYNQDYDEGFPATVSERQAPAGTPDTPDARAPFSYRRLLQPYIKNEQVFKCPSAPAWIAPAPGAWWSTDYGCHLNEAHLQPAANNHAADYAGIGAIDLTDFGFNDSTPLASINQPASFILCADAGRSDGTPSRGGLYPQPWAFDVPTQARMLARHQNGASIAYSDGHSRWRRPEQTWRSYEDNDWRRDPVVP